jgi:hypothetical protein
MCRARDSVVSRAQTLGRLCRPTLQALLVAWLVTLAGCASDPPVAVSASTWRQVDRDILLSMQHWMERVYQQTDDEFIPWFSGYWTQQWLGMKVSWYKLSTGGDKDPTVSRLALYLQEQYQERVLEPVAEEDDPDQIMERSTRLYVQELDQRLQGLAQRHAVPQEQFEQRLQAVPAITQAPGASLHELLQADPLKRLPAYVGLIEHIRATPGGLRDWSTDPGIASVAQRTSERLVDELTTSSAASAVGAMVGRVAGTTLSLGVAIFTAIARENKRPQTEAQLRQNLKSAFEAEWQELMRNTDHGVLAGVHQLSWRIESGLEVPFRYQPPR